MSRLRGDRFSAVIRGARGAGALNNFIKWVQTAEARQLDPAEAATRERLISQKLYIKPFGITLPGELFAVTSASTRAVTLLKGAVEATRALETLAGSAQGLRLGKFAPARVILKTGLGTPKQRTSHITKLKYKTRGGTSNSMPFGRKGAETYVAATTAIETELDNGRAPGSFSINFLPEVIGE